MDSFNSKIALITGAANGLGLALAKYAANLGMQLVLADIDADKLHDVAVRLSKLTTIIPVTVDVTKLNDWLKLESIVSEKFKQLHFLFNNAGILGKLAPIWQLEPDEVQRVFNTNVVSIINSLKVFMPLLLAQQQSSHIVNVASLFGFVSCSYHAAYSMSKHSVVNLSESLYHELKASKHNIGVSVLCPGYMQTGIVSNNSNNNKIESTIKSFSHLLQSEKDVDQVAKYTFEEIAKQKFYLIPHSEAFHFAEQRLKDIVEHGAPSTNFIEQVLQRYVPLN